MTPGSETTSDSPTVSGANTGSPPSADAASGTATSGGAKGHLTPEVEAEIEAAMQDLAAATGDDGAKKPAIRGPRRVQAGREHRTGTVVSVGPTDIFLEFGPKELGVLERQQFKEGDELPVVGEPYDVIVTRFDPAESLYICARPGAVQKADWEMLQPGQTVEARVTGTNKGGLELEVAGHRAFMPASQVALDRVNDLSVFVGEKLNCQVNRIDRAGKGNIVLSRRDVLQAERQEKAGKLRETLKEGDELDGTVRKIMPFGAFVDLGGVDGLVHVSDLSHDRVHMGEKNVARHVSEGQKLRVRVLKLDWDANRISLGIKQLQADPFQSAAADIEEGAEVTGRVTKIMEFGAFVEVAPGVEGLVHISELDWRRVANVEDVIKQDEIINVKVLKVDPDSRRVSLSLKQTKERPEGADAGGGGDRPPQKKPKGVSDRQGFRRGPERDTRSADEILKETPAMRRLREKFGKGGFKGGLS